MMVRRYRAYIPSLDTFIDHSGFVSKKKKGKEKKKAQILS